MEVLQAVLAALYAPGAPHGTALIRRRWPRVSREVRAHASTLESCPQVLSNAGLWLEARILEDTALLSWAMEKVRRAEVLTSACDRYPARWLATLEESAPPALWLQGSMPASPFFTIVGARSISNATASFVAECAASTASDGYCVASGGAAGTDRAATEGAAGNALQILPFGLHELSPAGGCTSLSLRPQNEPFDTSAAMERNGLLYALSSHTLVIEPKFKQGGTWHGAIDALRRRLCTVLVPDDGSQASRALIALGAVPVTVVESVLQAMKASPQQLQGSFAFG